MEECNVTLMYKNKAHQEHTYLMNVNVTHGPKPFFRNIFVFEKCMFEI